MLRPDAIQYENEEQNDRIVLNYEQIVRNLFACNQQGRGNETRSAATLYGGLM